MWMCTTGPHWDHIVQPVVMNLRWPFLYLAASLATDNTEKKIKIKSGRRAGHSVFWVSVHWDLDGATALLLSARLKSRSVWFGSALCLIRLFLGYRLTRSSSQMRLSLQKPFWFFLHSTSISYWLSWFSELCSALLLFWEVHSACCTLHKNVKVAFPLVCCSSGTSARFWPGSLFWSQRQCKVYWHTSWQECNCDWLVSHRFRKVSWQ